MEKRNSTGDVIKHPYLRKDIYYVVLSSGKEVFTGEHNDPDEYLYTLRLRPFNIRYNQVNLDGRHKIAIQKDNLDVDYMGFPVIPFIEPRKCVKFKWMQCLEVSCY